MSDLGGRRARRLTLAARTWFLLSGRLGKPKAITPTADKLALLIYTMLTKDTEFVDQGQDYYEERCRRRVVLHLKHRAAALASP